MDEQISRFSCNLTIDQWMLICQALEHEETFFILNNKPKMEQECRDIRLEIHLADNENVKNNERR